ncbi:MAG: micrococcal nuclease [Chloroflexota bacterium]|jgi:endonuclease YncB( thermonuclease family)|nr:micrococcal nuclease [Chloroflexota bacterium]
MRSALVLFSAALFVVACRHATADTPSPSIPVSHGLQPHGETQEATVTDIVDGDTIHVEIGGQEFRVRYIGIDAPEIAHDDNPGELLGAEASQANAALVEGQTVILEKDVSDTDQFGRLLRYVWLPPETDTKDWTMVELELAHTGMADVKSYPPDTYWQVILRQTQASARDAGLGIWASPANPPQTPVGGRPPY